VSVGVSTTRHCDPYLSNLVEVVLLRLAVTDSGTIWTGGSVYGGSAASGNAAQHGFQIGRTAPAATPGTWQIRGVRIYNLTGSWLDLQSDGGGGSAQIVGAVGAGLFTGTATAGTNLDFNTGSASTSYTVVRNIRGPSSTPVLADLGVLLGSSSGPLIKSGTGTPEGNITAPVGSHWLRTDGGAGTSFYVKESGAGNTGWVAK
jgi:hypothetical protein